MGEVSKTGFGLLDCADDGVDDNFEDGDFVGDIDVYFNQDGVDCVQ